MNTERPSITVVTRNGGYQKDRSYQFALKDWQIDRKAPEFDEDWIKRSAPNTEERPVYIAENKAKQDAAWVSAVCGITDSMISEAQKINTENGHIYLYTDTVQFVHQPDGTVTTHEKPQGDPVAWATSAPEALDQSGKTVEIVSALVGVRCDKDGVSDPKTVIVRVKAQMRPFTRAELIDYANGSGKTVIPLTGGGISPSNGGRRFYDTTKPLTVSVQDRLDAEPEELLRYDRWDHLPDEVLRPFTCGAVEPAVVRLVEKTAPQK